MAIALFQFGEIFPPSSKSKLGKNTSFDKKQNASQVSLVISFSQVKVGGRSRGEGGG